MVWRTLLSVLLRIISIRPGYLGVAPLPDGGEFGGKGDSTEDGTSRFRSGD